MMSKSYVAHDCRNCKSGKCNNRFLFKDLTNARKLPPSWAYCPECCEELDIDFEKQKPSDYRTEEENNRIKNNLNKQGA